MNTERNYPPASSNAPLYIILGVVGGGFLICGGISMVIIVGLVAIQTLGRPANSVFTTVGSNIGTITATGPVEAMDAVDDFANDLMTGQWDRACQRGTPEYRQRTTPETLRKLFESDPVLKKNNLLTFTVNLSGVSTPTVNTYEVSFSDADDRIATMTVTVTRSANGQWEISRATVP